MALVIAVDDKKFRLHCEDLDDLRLRKMMELDLVVTRVIVHSNWECFDISVK